MIGTATSNVQPFALARQRSTFGRDGLNLAALRDMTNGTVATPEKFWGTDNKFGLAGTCRRAGRRSEQLAPGRLQNQLPPGLDFRDLPGHQSADLTAGAGVCPLRMNGRA